MSLSRVKSSKSASAKSITMFVLERATEIQINCRDWWRRIDDDDRIQEGCTMAPRLSRPPRDLMRDDKRDRGKREVGRGIQNKNKQMFRAGRCL